MRIETIDQKNNRAGETVLHTHSNWELIYASAGRGVVEIGGHPYPFSPGTILCVPPEVPHRNRVSESYIHIAITVSHFTNPTGEGVSVLRDDENGTFEVLARLAMRLYYRCSGGDPLLLPLADTMEGLLCLGGDGGCGNTEVERLKEKIDRSYTDPEFRLADAMDGLAYSHDHLRRLFRLQVGCTPVSYLTQRRIGCAKRLLAETNGGKIAEVALRSGFYDARYFSRVFRSGAGMTPEEYRRTVR